jgi:hypothetical protein
VGVTPVINGLGYTLVVNGTPSGGYANIRTNTAAQFRAVSSTNTTVFGWTTLGWIDRRGRDS